MSEERDCRTCLFFGDRKSCPVKADHKVIEFLRASTVPVRPYHEGVLGQCMTYKEA